jgi:acyl-CoA reductase-like NAD-dependent aldehyde dehydrogenase
MLLSDGLPWGGFRESGLGKEGSVYGIEEYTKLKTVYADLREEQTKPWRKL